MKKLLIAALGMVMIFIGLILICLEMSPSAPAWMVLIPLVGFGMIAGGAAMLIKTYPEKFDTQNEINE